MTKTCSLDSCDRKYSARGLCAMHYSRARRAGTPLPAGRAYTSSPQESFDLNTRREGDCLIWTAANNGNGYGVIYASAGRRMLVHRWAYEQEHGPIPDGIQIDHRNHCSKLCCEVSHLRASTHSENQRNRRGAASNSSSGFRNVRWERRRGRWVAAVSTGAGTKSEGYKDLGFALQAAERMRRECYGAFAGKA